MKIKEALKALDALSHSVRLRIFRFLVKSGEKGCTVSELCSEMKLVPATLSFHMSKLVDGELVERTKEGRSIIYFSNPEKITDIANFLRE